jgi:hypothetical protein
MVIPNTDGSGFLPRAAAKVARTRGNNQLLIENVRKKARRARGERNKLPCVS